ncbi:hypothetical protein [Flavobacterium sp.]|uniref:hypothetical protein n=1 Tax=Flavobacterium sp. TaxID=239 RepID=UPI00375221A6
MNFEFINELRVLLQTNNIFMFLITGGKTLALALLTFKFLDGIIGQIGDENPKLNTLPKYIAYAFFIVSSDWIVDIIEGAFSMVDLQMGNTSSDLYTELNTAMEEQWNSTMAGCITWYDYLGAALSSVLFVITFVVAQLLMVLCKIADLSITTGYLLVRVFLIQFMKMVFPLIIALSTLDITKDLLGRWIKKYIGLFVLGIAYIGILHFTSLMQTALISQFRQANGDGLFTGVELNAFTFGMIVTIIVVFTVKVKLFQSVTSYVSNLFS